MKRLLGITMVLITLASGSGTAAARAEAAMTETRKGAIAPSASEVRPLLVGSSVPRIVLETVDEKRFDLNRALGEKPTVLIFYRGGWCPYCNVHLAQLQQLEPRLVELGYQIIAISADRPEKLREGIRKHRFTYTLLSDHRMEAARALGIAFRVDDDTLKKYKGYGIDLEADSGETHHLLPVPSAFIVGRDNVIKFSHVDPDYKVRIDPEVLLAAARAALKPHPAPPK